MFKLRGSILIHRESFSFFPITREFTHLVSSRTSLMMPILVILFSSAFNLLFNAKGNFSGKIDLRGNWRVNSYVVCCAQRYFLRNACRFTLMLEICLVSWSSSQVSACRTAVTAIINITAEIVFLWVTEAMHFPRIGILQLLWTVWVFDVDFSFWSWWNLYF